MEKLHDKINTDLSKNPIDDYRIVFLGDYIDRGPDSAGCVEFLINLMNNDQRVICLKGNHEDKLLRFLAEPIKLANSFFTYGGVECASSYGVNMTNFSGGESEILLVADELKQRIPARHNQFYSQLFNTVSFGDYMFAHAGVRPGIALGQQSEHDLIWIRAEFIPHQGLYEKVIIHGHSPMYPMEILPNRINVDTHAYETGVLSCLVLEDTDYRVIEA